MLAEIFFMFVFAGRISMLTEPKGNKEFSIVLEIAGVSPQDAGSYRVTAKNDLGESNATIGLNFDGRLLLFALRMRLSISLSIYSLVSPFYMLDTSPQ